MLRVVAYPPLFDQGDGRSRRSRRIWPRNIWRAVRMGSGRRTKIALSGETQVRSSKVEGGPPSMTMRTTSKTVTFHRPFWLKGVDRLLPPADYRVVTDEELIEGLSFPAYHRVSTVTVRIRGRDGDHRSFGPAGRAGPRCSHAHHAPGRWQVSVTAPRLDRRDHCRPFAGCGCNPNTAQKKGRPKAAYRLGRIKRLPMLMSASGTSATYRGLDALSGSPPEAEVSSSVY
jgi:hypothetical protein